MEDFPNYPDRKHRITLDLTPELAERLENYRKRYKKQPPVAQVVRDSLNKTLPPLPKKKQEDTEE